MPHCTLEYAGSLDRFDAAATLASLNRTLVASGQFEERDIKSRAMQFDAFAVGVADEPRAFVHAKLAILSGRSADVKRALSDSLLAALREHCNAAAGVHLQLSVEVVDIDRPSYAKANIEPR